MIGENSSSWLKRPFLEEVLLAIKGLNGENASGLDAFTLAFFQHCW